MAFALGGVRLHAPRWLALAAIAAGGTLPAYHRAQLALTVIGRGDGGMIVLHLAVLIGSTAGCFAIARRWLARAS